MSTTTALPSQNDPWTSKWMGEMKSVISHHPIADLILPGSHDACAYKLSSTEVTPFAPTQLNSCFAKHCCCCVGQNYAVAQTGSLYDQLLSGSRYLDMRVTFDEKKQLLRTEHALYGLPIDQLFQQIALFIKEHPTEIIIMHLRHFSVTKLYDMKLEHHDMILQLLEEIFDEDDFIKLNEINESLLELKKKKRKILLVYGTEDCSKANELDWIHSEQDVLPGGVGWTKSTTTEDLILQWKILSNKQQSSTTDDNSNDTTISNTPQKCYKVSTAITPDNVSIKDGILNCIFCCICRLICPKSCKIPAGLKEFSDAVSDALIDETKNLVETAHVRLNIMDMDHVVRQQKRNQLIETIVKLNAVQCQHMDNTRGLGESTKDDSVVVEVGNSKE
jgi:hypothetical protein